MHTFDTTRVTNAKSHIKATTNTHKIYISSVILLVFPKSRALQCRCAAVALLLVLLAVTLRRKSD